jgi:hypothetical protein
MRGLLTGYGVNQPETPAKRRLFQNRYKSIVCQEDAYLFKSVRYIHLNPLRARRVSDLKAEETGDDLSTAMAPSGRTFLHFSMARHWIF